MTTGWKIFKIGASVVNSGGDTGSQSGIGVKKSVAKSSPQERDGPKIRTFSILGLALGSGRSPPWDGPKRVLI